jgi:hypothetical protein
VNLPAPRANALSDDSRDARIRFVVCLMEYHVPQFALVPLADRILRNDRSNYPGLCALRFSFLSKDSNSRNAVNFASACTTKRFPSSR